MTAWLIDKSALVRLGVSVDAPLWAERIDRGLVRISTVTRLEIGYSARSAADLRGHLSRAPLASMPVEHQTPAIEARALTVQLFLAERGQHRAPSVPDLVVATTAELHGLVVLHLEKDYDLITQVTGQPVERLELD